MHYDSRRAMPKTQISSRIRLRGRLQNVYANKIELTCVSIFGVSIAVKLTIP